MPLAMESALVKRGTAPPQFSAHVCCDQTARWIKMLRGREVGLGQGDIVLDGDPPPPKKGHSNPSFFGPCLLWPHGWIDKDATWYGGRPQHRRHWVRWEPNFPKKGHSSPPPLCGPCLLWPNSRMDLDATWYGGRPRPRPYCVVLTGTLVYCGQTVGWIKMPLGTELGLGPVHCVRWGPSSPHGKGHSSPPHF